VIADHWGLSVGLLVFGFLSMVAAFCGLVMPKRVPVANINADIIQ
jgi:hypothetical protein